VRGDAAAAKFGARAVLVVHCEGVVVGCGVWCWGIRVVRQG
jgi:hypothetical protein